MLGLLLAATLAVDLKPVTMFNQHLYYGPFKTPLAIAFDRAHSELWVADTGSNLIGIYRPDGASLFSFALSDRFHQPLRLAVNSKGRMVMIEGDRAHLRQFNYRGEYKGDVSLPGMDAKPLFGAIAFDNDDNLYAGDNHSGQIFVYSPDGKLRRQFGSLGDDEGQFEAICGIAIDGDGTIYVADQRSISVQVFDRQGNFLRGWGRHEMGKSNFSLPSGIAIDSQGHIVVTDELRHEIKLFEKDGTFLGRFGGLGVQAGEIAFPTDVATDAKGRIYVSERTNSRVQVFELTH